MSALGVGSVINFYWLQPVGIILLLVPVSALLIRGTRNHNYGPFCLGLLSAIAMYFFKFTHNSEVGIYLSGSTLFAAAIWNALLQGKKAEDTECECR